MKPAHFIIILFGGVRATGRTINRSASAVSMWRKPILEGGTNGAIPRKVQQTIMKLFKRRKIKITTDILMNGGTKAQLAELMRD